MARQLDEHIKELLTYIVKHFDEEDRIVRNQQLLRYRRLKLYWNNFSQIYWSETARDYRIYAPQELAQSDADQAIYDRPVNVFRAFLETIIAALSIQVPAVRCVPDDADNANDITTAEAGNRIAELWYKHNDVLFYWLYALYVHMTEGMVAAYTYEKEDKSFGTYKEKQYKNVEEEQFVCPHCQAKFDQLEAQAPIQLQGLDPEDQNIEAIDFTAAEQDEFAPDDDDAPLHALMNEEPVCPECGVALDPELQKSKVTINRFVGMIDRPKARVCMNVHGGLFVKIANYAQKQEDTPYLIYSYETHYANALECYPEFRKDIPEGGWSGNTGVSDPFEQMARLNPQYRNAFPEEQVTVKESWLRPAAFNIVAEEDTKLLKKQFPDGCKVCHINMECVDYENEALDDCWTLTRNPLHDYLNHDPLGELLTNIQDITNDLISLTLQLIEHGIEQTWADPSVVNFNAQRQIEAVPGFITPTKAQAGSRAISEAFFSTKAASVSPEIFQFYQIVNQLGQFVSAAMPSIFGGAQQGSETASEYAMSRTASLQRLQTPWRMFTIWWKEIFGKVIPAYMKCIKDDERFVKRKDDGSGYINVYIRKSELAGKIGNVELEASEQIPISDEQKADIIMKLMELNNQEILLAFTSPENLPMLRKLVKIPEFRLPGEDDRTKQYEEIKMLLQNQPQPLPPAPKDLLAAASGIPIQPQFAPSVTIDPLVDDHAIQAQICKSWAVSEAGRLAKIENPPGYQNVLLHMQQHMQQLVTQMQMQMAQQQTTDQNGQNNQTSPEKPKGDTQVDEVSDARTPVQ